MVNFLLITFRWRELCGVGKAGGFSANLNLSALNGSNGFKRLMASMNMTAQVAWSAMQAMSMAMALMTDWG